LADEQNAGYIKGHQVIDTGYAVGRVLAGYTGNKIAWMELPGGGDMLKTDYALDATTVKNADKVDNNHASAFALASHKTQHVSGGDKFAGTDYLDCISRIQVQKNSVEYPVGKRRTLNFIEGDGITLTIADGSAEERVNVTITATAGEAYGVTNEFRTTVSGTNPIVVAHGMTGAPDGVVLGINALQSYMAEWTADGTNITIHHNAMGSLTVSIYAWQT
jgi:hypothetical protein